jgi:predicted ATPase with chaperone activity
LLDRIDIHIEVPRLSPEELMNKRDGEATSVRGEEATRGSDKRSV